jgi:hypothetical protein
MILPNPIRVNPSKSMFNGSEKDRTATLSESGMLAAALTQNKRMYPPHKMANIY